MASQWAAKRKLFYSSIVIIGALLIIGVPTFFYFYRAPTCDDGVQNQDEKGIDCGGMCKRLCASEISDPIVLWQRVFQVAPGVYNAVAYIRNPNVQTEVKDVPYRFRLYDEKSILIVEKTGHTFIPANQTFAVFEADIRTGSRTATRATFDFTEIPQWSDRLINTNKPVLSVQDITLKNETSAPRLEATIVNKSLIAVPKLDAVAIIYDKQDNAIAASRTIVENLLGELSQKVTFTWPSPFSDTAVRKEVITRIYPSQFSY
jgi:hypothetical protein